MAIASATQVRGFLRALSGTADDTTLDTFIARFDEVASGWCGFPLAANQITFENNTYTHYFDGDGSDTLQLRVVPANTISSVYVDVDRSYGSDTLVDSGDYTLDSDLGLLLLDTDSDQGSFTTGYRSVKVTYTAGFTSIPDAIVHACGVQVAHWYSNRDTIGKPKINQHNSSIDVRSLELLPEVRQALRPFRIGGAAGGWIG